MKNLKSIKLPNGDMIRVNQKVIIKGNEPKNTIYYAPEMLDILKKCKIHIIDEIVAYSDKILISASGWSWDSRNVFKIKSDKKKRN